jgi:hypothetical protein
VPEKSLLLIKRLANKKILNAVLFQLGWFACILGGDAIAFITTLVILCLHQVFFEVRRTEWYLIAFIVVTGFIVDNIWSYLGVLGFQSPTMLFIPIWLVCIWALFAATLNHSLYWLKDRLLLSSLLVSISGPLSYLAGSKMAGVTLTDPPIISLLCISVCWAILLPIFFMVILYVTQL